MRIAIEGPQLTEVNFYQIFWRASETLSGVTQWKIGEVCLYVWTYVCHFVVFVFALSLILPKLH